jgi:hypothetical protein
VDEAVCEVDEVDLLDPTVPPILPRLRIQPPKAGPLNLRKLLLDKPDKKLRKANLQLKLPTLERETISQLLVDGETHLLQRKFRRLPSLETQDGQEKENRQCHKSTRLLLLQSQLLLDHQS